MKAAYFGDVFFFVAVAAPVPFSLIAIPAGAAHASLDQDEDVDVEDREDEDVTPSGDLVQPASPVQAAPAGFVTPLAVTAVTQVDPAALPFATVGAAGSAAIKRRIARRDIVLLLFEGGRSYRSSFSSQVALGNAGASYVPATCLAPTGRCRIVSCRSSVGILVHPKDQRLGIRQKLPPMPSDVVAEKKAKP